MKYPIAIYGSHDSSICVKISSDEYRIYELERITGMRHYSLNTDPHFWEVLLRMKDFLAQEHGFIEFSSLFYSECESHVLNQVNYIFQPDHAERMQHHFGHAACALWESPFEKALIVSFDGGGSDNEGNTFFNIFEGDKATNTLKKIVSLPLHICDAYTRIAWPLECIKKTGPESYLSWAGKIMGLVAYGGVESSWIPAFRKFYYGNINDDSLFELFNTIRGPFPNSAGMNTIADFDFQASIAATSQAVFEDIFLSAIAPYINKSELPVCVTGGGALNVLLNQLLHNFLVTQNKKMFVPCNPNDCGLALGFMLMRFPPDSGVLSSVAYSGFPLVYPTDEEFNHKMVINGNGVSLKSRSCDLKELAELLVEGHIIGFVQGCSEVGPRALGNRSILAYPKSKGVWDEVNSEIKFRERFRPLSPVCMREEVGQFISGPFDSEYMTYSQKVHDFISSVYIAHEDGTARMQTVSDKQNPALYDLLEQVAELTGFGVLINTSFNSKGKPILTTVTEALDILRETPLDGVWIEGELYTKSERKIFKY